MESIRSLLEWITSHEAVLWWLFAVSIVLLVTTPLVVTWLVVRLPTDYFTARRRQPSDLWQQRRVLRPLMLVVKNAIGIVLFTAGLVMLVVPGQGLLTMAVGLMLVDFPGKFRAERWLVTRRPVWRSINWLRDRGGRAPLEPPI